MGQEGGRQGHRDAQAAGTQVVPPPPRGAGRAGPCPVPWCLPGHRTARTRPFMPRRLHPPCAARAARGGGGGGVGSKASVLTCVCCDSVVGVGEDEGVGGGAGLARRWTPVVSVWGGWGAAVVLWGGDVGGSGLACLAGATEHRRGREGGRAPERCRAPEGPRVREEGAAPDWWPPLLLPLRAGWRSGAAAAAERRAGAGRRRAACEAGRECRLVLVAAHQGPSHTD